MKRGDKQLQVILEEQNVAAENAAMLLSAFGAPFEEAGEILRDYETIKVSDETDVTTMQEARAKRLALKKVRTTVENKRKELKEDIIRSGRAIDSVARFVKEVITPAEQYLQLQEDYAKIKAEERKSALRAERLSRLSEHTKDAGLYNIDDMTDDQFEALLVKLKSELDAALEAQRKAEEEARAQAEARRVEQERIRAENEQLRKAAEEERRKREELERAELERRQEAERAQRLAAEEERQAALAPDRQKLLGFADALSLIASEKLPVVTSSEAQAVVDSIRRSLNHIETQVREKARTI